MSQKLLYIAGPYRSATYAGRQANIAAARQAAVEYWKRGFAVICPHMNSANMDGEADDEDFLKGDLTILERCDVCVMITGWQGSVGAVQEHEFAEKQGIPIWYWHAKVGDDDQSAGEEPAAAEVPAKKLTPKDAIGRLKPGIRYLPPGAIMQVGEAAKYGALHANGGKGYGPFNWREDYIEAGIYYDALFRHLAHWHEREDADRDSGCHPLSHVAAGCLIVLDAIEHGMLIDDRPGGCNGTTADS